MNWKAAILWCAVALLFGSLLAGACDRARGEVIGLWFAPDDDCESAIVQQFDHAKKSIHYQMYNFTSEPIATAMIKAHERGVEVVILLDHVASLQRACQADRCANEGCKVFVDWSHPIAHNKVRIVDGKLTLGGSYNDSAQAKRNAENLTLDDDREIASKFEANFQRHLSEEKTKPLKQSRAEDAKRRRTKRRETQK